MHVSPVAEPGTAAGVAPRSLTSRPASARSPWPALLVVALTALGIAVRVAVAHDSLFADELSTAWIVTDHGFGGVLSTVHSNAEITPPLYFLLSWLTTRLGHAPELVRLPSLIAGVLTIPAVYALGLRTVGRAAALVAAALTTLAPFMVYYSTEARGYALMMALVVGSTLAMLAAVDTGRRRWWVAYAACSLGAAYTHYTCIFALVAQFAWLLWAHPEARRAAVVANAAAAVGFIPWLSGLHNDLTSPTNKILSALSPFDPASIRIAYEHWSVGYPYATLPLRDLPGLPALIALAVALVAAVAGLALRVARGVATRVPDRRLALVVLLALSVPVGEMVISAVSTHIFGVRNLAASWPALALTLAALLVAAGPRLRYVVGALAVVAVAVGGVKMLEGRYRRPDYRAAAAYVERHARPGDVVIDETAVLSPGPLSPLDVTLGGGHPVLRAAAPAERDHPFNFFDRIVPAHEAIGQAVARASGHRVFVVFDRFPADVIPPARLAALRSGSRFPPSYHPIASRLWPSFINPLEVRVYTKG